MEKVQAWIDSLGPYIICNWSEPIEVWLARRIGMVTGSKIGVILGYASWQTPLQLLLEFRHPDETRPVAKHSSGWLRMEIGTRAEEPIRETAEADPNRPGRYESIANPARLIRHPEYEWAACSPDGLAWSAELGKCLIEIKNTNIGMLHKYTTDDGEPCMPSNYRAQVLWNMACTGADTGILVANFNGDIKYRVIERNEADIEMLMGKAERFLEAVKNDDAMLLMDIVEDAASTNKLMNELFRKSTGAEFSIDDPALDDSIAECIDVRAQIKGLTERKSGLEAAIKAQLATGKRMDTARHKVTWGQSLGRERFDSESFAAAHPQLATQYTVKGLPYRTGLRLTAKKEKTDG